MTREDAIKIVKEAFDTWEWEFCSQTNDDWTDAHEARDMAIKALEQPEIIRCKDCICCHCEVWLSGDGGADVYGYCGRTQLRVLPYDYCSKAERRKDE